MVSARDSLHLITPSLVPCTKCHGPLDGSQDYIMIIGEFSTSSKDDSAAHILQITKWSSWKSKI